MEIQVTGKNIELPPTARDYVIRKLDKINRHLPNILAFDVEIAEEKTRQPEHRFVVQVTVNSNGTLLRGEERGQDLFTAVDKVALVMNRQAEHFKGKSYRKGRGGATIRGANEKSPTPTEVVEAELPVGPEVVKTKRFDVKPMPLDEAIDQMVLLGHDFFLFINSDTERLNLIYRRKDGNYGLIEPVIK